MSLNIPAPPLKLLPRVRHQLRKIPGAAHVWHLVQRVPSAARYYLLRAAGFAAYPVLGDCGPLLGYHAKTRSFAERGGGSSCLNLAPASATGATASPDFFQPERFVAVIPRARVLYESGVVVSPDHRMLADVSWEGRGAISEARRHPVMRRLSLPPIEHVTGRVAVMSSVSADNYYHWIFDVLPRFGALEESGLVPDRYIVNTTTQFQRDSLNVLNIVSDRIINPSSTTHIEADELIIPSLPGPPYHMSPQLSACAYLRSTFLRSERAHKPHRAIYITRADAGTRRVVNEAEVREEMIDNGFEVVSLTNVPFLKQVELFAEARIVVGPHGAGFTNAVFCAPGTVLIEFMPERWGVDCFERLARLVGITYRSIKGTEASVPDDSHDHSVDCAELRRVLRQFC